ncbi:hypothetical protein [Halobellus litoreus]|uniref:Uncharacterized protein n=1 Tax=Halobellus litoreus TaxID=755310 RepID=A0ABD6E024_9EURY|nr:hypothetical protein [Halobellus litoreus]
MSDRARTIRNELVYMLDKRPDYRNWDLVKLDVQIEHLLDELSEIEGRRVGLHEIYRSE